MHAVGLEVGPQLLGDDAGLVVDLELERAPVGQVFVAEPGRISGNQHRTGHRLQDTEKRDMVGVRIVEAVAALRLARRLHAGRVAADEPAAVEVEIGLEAVGAAAVEFNRIAQRKLSMARRLRSMPMLRRAGGLRFMMAPPPRCDSTNASCGGHIPIGGRQSNVLRLRI